MICKDIRSSLRHEQRRQCIPVTKPRLPLVLLDLGSPQPVPDHHVTQTVSDPQLPPGQVQEDTRGTREGLGNLGMKLSARDFNRSDTNYLDLPSK